MNDLCRGIVKFYDQILPSSFYPASTDAEVKKSIKKAAS